MKNFLLICFLFAVCGCSKPKTDTWAEFLKCDSNCTSQVLAVKDAFLQDPKKLLTSFQATYEQGDDRVVGWLYMLRDSVLLNPEMGTIEQRLAMQKDIIAAAKPFENDPKVHEMAKSVMDELGIADIKTGKINDPMAATTDENCYQHTMNGDTTSCQLTLSQNGEFTGYYYSAISEKDGSAGILKGKQIAGSDTLLADFKYYQEGMISTEQLMFVKKGDKIFHLESDSFDKEGRMIFSNRKELKVVETLVKVDCDKLKNIIQYIQADEKDLK
jgi:hypothetical protein